MHTGLLIGLLAILLLLSAFFSSSETSMMAINRYRLRHLVRKRHKGAIRVSKLLETPDHLISTILIGNNFVNIFSSTLATAIALKIWGNSALAIVPFLLTFIILIFGEVTPKTIAAKYPEKVSFFSSYALTALSKILYPVVMCMTWICGLLMKPFGIKLTEIKNDHLDRDELRTLVDDACVSLSEKNKGMLLSILDLDRVRVDDVMIPRNAIIGIDITDNINTIMNQLRTCQHSYMPVYKETIDNIIGMLQIRKIVSLLTVKEINKTVILQEAVEPYYVPMLTNLYTQLLNFQKTKEQSSLVVGEYGDILGLITVEDILEEIVGDFTSTVSSPSTDIRFCEDRGYILSGSASIRDINRALGWNLPTDDARTINGLITEVMEAIPKSSVCWKVGNYRFEILQVKDNRVKSVKMFVRNGL